MLDRTQKGPGRREQIEQEEGVPGDPRQVVGKATSRGREVITRKLKDTGFLGTCSESGDQVSS